MLCAFLPALKRPLNGLTDHSEHLGVVRSVLLAALPRREPCHHHCNSQSEVNREHMDHDRAAYVNYLLRKFELKSS